MSARSNLLLPIQPLSFSRRRLETSSTRAETTPHTHHWNFMSLPTYGLFQRASMLHDHGGEILCAPSQRRPAAHRIARRRTSPTLRSRVFGRRVAASRRAFFACSQLAAHVCGVAYAKPAQCVCARVRIYVYLCVLRRVLDAVAVAVGRAGSRSRARCCFAGRFPIPQHISVPCEYPANQHSHSHTHEHNNIRQHSGVIAHVRSSCAVSYIPHPKYVTLC